ncbi:MAG: VOC family protein [Micrococcaceae bacterium]
MTPNLWFSGNAKEAADYYTSIFPSSEITKTVNYPISKEEGLTDFQLDLTGKTLTIDFLLGDMDFVAINAGPEFKFNSANSFEVHFNSTANKDVKEKVTKLWESLTDGGKIIVPLGDNYGFVELYGQVIDRYGLLWLLATTAVPEDQDYHFIVPTLGFSGPVVNKANEAVDYYTSVFKDSKADPKMPYAEHQDPLATESLMYSTFTIAGQTFTAYNSDENDTFNEAVSYMILCKDQEEIDYFWNKLSAVPESEQCGWCKDKYGVSWQIVPENMDELMTKPDAYKTMMKQHKIVIAEY